MVSRWRFNDSGYIFDDMRNIFKDIGKSVNDGGEKQGKEFHLA